MNDYTKPQPPPVNEDTQSVWALVIEDLDGLALRKGMVADRDVWHRLAADARERNAFGIRKYGVALSVHNGRDAATDAYQEALDGCVYWRQEYERTRDEDALALYEGAKYHAMHCRDYLYRRDGK